ncbi:unnamed protein product [Cyprideis torosa]|uniref:Uncharacterized protein n=1 Tax=Cyprideis torosa TaxID=163714 RepID=A0A7R8W1D4_9CRUS|nr:unnamed protein product [Cyprideis torosa]CAG0879671.1 unnamed protein product [Cyprideis torosa]
MPSYFHETFPEAKPWIFNVVPWVFHIISSYVGARFADALLRRNTPKVYVRKIMETIHLWTQGLIFLVIPFVDNFPLALLLMTIAAGVGALHINGAIANVQDIAIHHSGSIFGFVNTGAAEYSFPAEGEYHLMLGGEAEQHSMESTGGNQREHYNQGSGVYHGYQQDETEAAQGMMRMMNSAQLLSSSGIQISRTPAMESSDAALLQLSVSSAITVGRGGRAAADGNCASRPTAVVNPLMGAPPQPGQQRMPRTMNQHQIQMAYRSPPPSMPQSYTSQAPRFRNPTQPQAPRRPVGPPRQTLTLPATVRRTVSSPAGQGTAQVTRGASHGPRMQQPQVQAQQQHHVSSSVGVSHSPAPYQQVRSSPAAYGSTPAAMQVQNSHVATSQSTAMAPSGQQVVQVAQIDASNQVVLQQIPVVATVGRVQVAQHHAQTYVGATATSAHGTARYVPATYNAQSGSYQTGPRNQHPVQQHLLISGATATAQARNPRPQGFRGGRAVRQPNATSIRPQQVPPDRQQSLSAVQSIPISAPRQALRSFRPPARRGMGSSPHQQPNRASLQQQHRLTAPQHQNEASEDYQASFLNEMHMEDEEDEYPYEEGMDSDEEDWEYEEMMAAGAFGNYDDQGQFPYEGEQQMPGTHTQVVRGRSKFMFSGRGPRPARGGVARGGHLPTPGYPPPAYPQQGYSQGGKTPGVYGQALLTSPAKRPPAKKKPASKSPSSKGARTGGVVLSQPPPSESAGPLHSPAPTEEYPVPTQATLILPNQKGFPVPQQVAISGLFMTREKRKIILVVENNAPPAPGANSFPPTMKDVVALVDQVSLSKPQMMTSDGFTIICKALDGNNQIDTEVHHDEATIQALAATTQQVQKTTVTSTSPAPTPSATPSASSSPQLPSSNAPQPYIILVVENNAPPAPGANSFPPTMKDVVALVDQVSLSKPQMMTSDGFTIICKALDGNNQIDTEVHHDEATIQALAATTQQVQKTTVTSTSPAPTSSATPSASSSPQLPSSNAPQPYKPLLKPGFLALCTNCGMASPDFFKCIRCKKQLPEDCKTVPDGKDSGGEIPPGFTGKVLGQDERDLDGCFLSFLSECLTLSSDEGEGEEYSQPEDGTPPAVPDSSTGGDSGLGSDDFCEPFPSVRHHRWWRWGCLPPRRRVSSCGAHPHAVSSTDVCSSTERLTGGGHRKPFISMLPEELPDPHIRLKIKKVHIGSYCWVSDFKEILLDTDGISVMARPLDQGPADDEIQLFLDVHDLMGIWISANDPPVIFIYVRRRLAASIASTLKMSEESGPYFNCGSQGTAEHLPKPLLCILSPLSPLTPDSSSPLTPDSSSPLTRGSSPPLTPDSSSPLTRDSSPPLTPDSSSPLAPDSSSPHESIVQLTFRFLLIDERVKRIIVFMDPSDEQIGELAETLGTWYKDAIKKGCSILAVDAIKAKTVLCNALPEEFRRRPDVNSLASGAQRSEQTGQSSNNSSSGFTTAQGKYHHTAEVVECRLLPSADNRVDSKSMQTRSKTAPPHPGMSPDEDTHRTLFKMDGFDVKLSDYMVLEEEQFLNDTVIDFYLQYIWRRLTDRDRNRTHVFNSYFYKVLTAKSKTTPSDAKLR